MNLKINVIIMTTVTEADNSQANYIHRSFPLHLSWVFCGFALGVAALAVLYAALYSSGAWLSGRAVFQAFVHEHHGRAFGGVAVFYWIVRGSVIGVHPDFAQI